MAEEQLTEQGPSKQVIIVIVVTLTLLTLIQCRLYKPALLFFQNYLEHKKLKQFISRLNINLGLTGEDIADVLWLALKRQEHSAQTTEPPYLIVQEAPETDCSTQPDNNICDNQNQIETPSPDPKKPSGKLHPPSPPTPHSQTLKGKTLPLRHIDPPSLRKPLEFAKKLRPLMRRVDSGRQTILDEVETVQRTAEETICIPILKSEPEPWLDLALVIDDNSSMVLWKHLIKDLKQLLEHYGIFREVRTWGLTSDNQGKIAIRTKFSQQEQFKTPQELTDPTGRRLILIVSDCVSSMWFDGTLLSPLQNWTQHQPLALIQILPDKLWLRSGLRMGAAVKLGNSYSGAANRNLSIHELLIWKDFDLEQGSKIPVLTLEPEVAGRWSDFLVGKHDQIMAGFIFPTESDFWVPPQLPQSQITQLNAEQRIERFRRISSPTGRKLAGLLAAAPVITLPVVRLIQQLLLPESSPVHVAEVFLGGILKSLSEITTETNPNAIIFDVVQDDIRDILLKDAPLNDSQYIFEVISDFIERQLEKTLRECVALLKISLKEGSEVITPEKAYAQIALKVLKGLGGTYTQWADEILENPEPEPELNPSPLSLEPLEFKAKVATILFENETNESRKKLKTILLVENQPEVIHEISSLLSSSDQFKVRGTEQVNDIIQQVNANQIDLILINYDLPNTQYDQQNLNGIEVIRLLRQQLGISSFIPIIGFSVLEITKRQFLKYADGFYNKKKALQPSTKQEFINYIRKVFNRVKVTEILPYESKSDLDSVLDLINKRDAEELDTSEEEVANLFGKPKKDDGTYYLLENLCLLRILDRLSRNKVEPGTVNYRLSNPYVNQESPVTPSLPEIEEFKIRRQKLYEGQQKLLKEIEKRNNEQQTTSQGDVAVLFNHPEGGNIATYRRLENLRLLGFLTIVDIGTNQETIKYDLSHQYRQYLTLKTSNNPNSIHGIDLKSFQFKTPTVNRRGQIITTTTHTASYFTEPLHEVRSVKSEVRSGSDDGNDNVILEMVAIPGGTFTMGSAETEGYEDEKPHHNVTLSPFFMGKYPITQAQWNAIASQTELKVNIDLDEDPAHFKGDNRPVEKVNWYEAVEFCQRLSKLTGRDYQLPSEAQWEYACRAMTDSLDLENGESYPPFYFGETITGELANYYASNTYADEPQGEYRRETTPVGQFPANAFGLYDMHGNVWEWCLDDWHDNYEDAPNDGSARIEFQPSYLAKNKQNNSNSVLRGGSWYYNPLGCRSAFRYSYNRRDNLNPVNGFRVVCLFGRTQ